MRDPHAPPMGVRWRVLRVALAVVAMVFVVLTVGRELMGPRSGGDHPPALGMASPDPIASEADVFRLGALDVAVPPGAERRPTAHPRTMSMYRSVRAYPGAPPRVPHGLTEEEVRTPTSCNSCHERGGYSPRFGLYAPVTPHPQQGQCLQCHVPVADLVGLPLPDGTRSSTCRQCHRLEGRTPPFAALDWPVPDWPELGGRALEGGPPVIPHDLHMRGSCLACHGGPAAVREIRTTHPERSNCRQCHVPAASAEVFTRPLDGATGAEGTP